MSADRSASKRTEDRLAIRNLVEAYASYADRRDAEHQVALFTPDARFRVYTGTDSSPSLDATSREQLRPIFEGIERYVATTHFLGQVRIEFDDDGASGETYCMAHHVSGEAETHLMVAAVRYLDRFVETEDGWHFSERKVVIDWTETRSITT